MGRGVSGEICVNFHASYNRDAGTTVPVNLHTLGPSWVCLHVPVVLAQFLGDERYGALAV